MIKMNNGILLYKILFIPGALGVFRSQKTIVTKNNNKTKRVFKVKLYEIVCLIRIPINELLVGTG